MGPCLKIKVQGRECSPLGGVYAQYVQGHTLNPYHYKRKTQATVWCSTLRWFTMHSYWQSAIVCSLSVLLTCQLCLTSMKHTVCYAENQLILSVLGVPSVKPQTDLDPLRPALDLSVTIIIKQTMLFLWRQENC